MENWIQHLMESVFDKVDKESVEVNTSGKSRYLALKMEEDHGFLLSERNISRYYKGYINGEIKKIRPNKATRNVFAKYLGYYSFEDFVKQNETREGEVLRKLSWRIKKLHRNMLFSLIFNIILIGGLLFFISRYYKKNCMIWINDHYEKIRCSGLELETGLNKDVLEKFKKNTDNR
ncbi:hypothetical protein [Sinomicrobium sp. M5D2P9]